MYIHLEFLGSVLYVNEGKEVGLVVGDCMLVGSILALSIVVGVWPMAVLLWQHVEYYFFVFLQCMHQVLRAAFTYCCYM